MSLYQKHDDIEQAIALMESLDARERRCLIRIGRRLLDGQKTFGPLSPGKKDWKKEAKEEAMDLAVYLSALLEDDNDDG